MSPWHFFKLQSLNRHFRTNYSTMSPPIDFSKRNIEIKARISDELAFQERIDIAKKLTNTDGSILKQQDVFFNVHDGRLKLRMEVSDLSTI